MRLLVFGLAILAAFTSQKCAADWQEWELRGRVVDEAGRPVAGATVDHLWRANGTQKRPDGSPLDLTSDEQLKIRWGREGQMEPMEGTTTEADGSFNLLIAHRRHAVIAMDAPRQRGGLAIIAK